MTKNKTIFLGTDHGGYELKNTIKEWLLHEGYQVEDKGAFVLDPDDDYPEFAFAVAEAVVASGESGLGLLFCRSGGGVAIAANKVRGARALEIGSPQEAQYARQVNDANIATLPADWLSEEQCKAIIKAFLEADFSNEERHARRVAQIVEYEEQNR